MRHYPLSICIAIVIWVVCMIPIPETPLNEISFIDKWTHFVMYATLTLSILVENSRASRKYSKVSFSSNAILIIIPIIMGCLIELAQAYLTTCRSGDWFDALCNSLGSILGLGIFLLYSRLMQQKR